MLDLLRGVLAVQARGDLVVDVVDGLQHALAEDSGSSSSSRSSSASWAPVLAPLGTAARPLAPSARITSTSTVGLPRLSRISRA